MKLKFILILQLFIFTACPTLMAQPAAVKNVAKSVFSLTTFSADGSLLANSHGVFVGTDGEAVSDLKPFIGAAKAVVVDAQGNKMNVTRILGLNELYDVIRRRQDLRDRGPGRHLRRHRRQHCKRGLHLPAGCLARHLRDEIARNCCHKSEECGEIHGQIQLLHLRHERP